MRMIDITNIIHKDTKNIRSTFHDLISLTFCLAIRESRNKNIKKVKNGKKRPILIHENIFSFPIIAFI